MPLWFRKERMWSSHSTISNSGEPYEVKVSRTARREGGAARLLPIPVKPQLIDIAEVILPRSRGTTSPKRRIDAGKHGLRGTPHLRPIGLPHNPLECGLPLYDGRVAVGRRRLHTPGWAILGGIARIVWGIPPGPRAGWPCNRNRSALLRMATRDRVVSL